MALTSGTARLTGAEDKRLQEEYTVANTKTVYEGSLCHLNANGRLVAGHATDRVFAGMAVETVTGDSTKTARVAWGMTSRFAITNLTAGQLRKNVYIADDTKVGAKAGSGTAATNAIRAGVLVQISGSKGWVRLGDNAQLDA